jgi:hypothetical protein
VELEKGDPDEVDTRLSGDDDAKEEEETEPLLNGPAQVSSPRSRRVKLTAYRIVTILAVLGFGTAKAVQSLHEQSISASWTEWVGGAAFAAM